MLASTFGSNSAVLLEYLVRWISIRYLLSLSSLSCFIPFLHSRLTSCELYLDDMLLRLLSARTHPDSTNRRGLFVLFKRVCENLGDLSTKMEKKCKSPPSWAHRSSPADFFTEKTADIFADCPPEEDAATAATRVVTRRTQSKSTRLLKRMKSAGSVKRSGRLDSSRNSSHSPMQGVGREGPSELEETSFVAARSESVLSTAPVLCPPVPAEWEMSHHRKYAQKSDDFSESSFAPTNSYADNSGQEITSPDELDSTNDDDLNKMHHKTVHPRLSAAASAREPDGPSDTSFAARTDAHAGYFYELCKLPSLEKLFDYSTASQTSFTEDAIFTTQQSFGDPSVDQQTSNQYQIGIAPRGSSTTKDGRRKRSILISGEIHFCPEEGILTREPNCSVQAPARDSQDYKSTRLEFKNASNEKTTLTQRMLLWGERVLRKRPSRKTFPRRQQATEPKRLVQWKSLGGCLRRPHISNASTQASPASVLAT